MLVNRSPVRGEKRRASDDTGSAIVSVLIVMILLSLMGLTAAAIVTNTTGSVVQTRGSVQAKAAADAGITAALAQARRTSEFCSLSLSGSQPSYTVTSSCASNQVTFTSTGRGTDGGTTKTQAVYAYTPAKDVGMGADLTFFNSATFTYEVKTVSPGNALTINIPKGDFTCQVPIAASIRVQGSFITKGSCDVAGSVTAGGSVEMTNGSDTVRGNLSAAGTDKSLVRGSVGGALTVGGSLEFGWEQKIIGGNVQATGDVKLGSQRLSKALTFPAGKKFEQDQGVVSGTISRPAAVTAPAAPSFDAWFDYAYKSSDWPGYSIITLTASGTGPGTCNYFNAHPATGWTSLSSLTTPTVLDARACSNLSANSGTDPVVTLKTDLVMLAKSYDLTMLTMTASSGTKPKVRVIVEDTTKDAKPSCTNGAGSININGTSMASGITALAYTPCTVDVHGIGGRDKWNGSLYSGAFSYGGLVTFSSSPISLPGITGGLPVLGDLVSQRDIR
ncbi:exported hypothetical protein [Microbacterium sp. C448]|nr:exported hypothetical protein [Microbacterium sp. C448]